ncbi:hypothetical protein ABIB51_000400 [Arthrobacter sp. UYCu712]
MSGFAGMALNLRLPAGWAAAGPSGLPPGRGGVQELDLFRVEVAAAVFVPLGVDQYPEGVLPL